MQKDESVMSKDIKDWLKKFWDYRDKNNIEIYNEDSLKFELGLYLREKLKGTNYKVQFERNVNKFGIDKSKTVKSEIDIVIFSDDSREKYAIELKYPRHGQYTQRVYNFITDIVFMEKVKVLGGFSKTFTMVVIDDDKMGRLFRQGGIGKNSMFDYFRSESGDITKKALVTTLQFVNPKNKNQIITIEGNYEPISWIGIPRCKGINADNEEEKPRHYFIIETNNC